METQTIFQKEIHLDDLVQKCKKLDLRVKHTYSLFIVLYSIVLVVYLLKIDFSTPFNYEHLNYWVRITSFLLGFITIFVFIVFRKREYKRLDYSLPTYTLLKNISNRFKYFRKNDIWAFAGLMIVTLGRIFSTERSVLVALFPILIGLIIGTIITYIYWSIKHKPIKKDAEEIIRQLEA